MIKAKDPRLHRISVAYKGFIVLERIPIPKGTPFIQPLFVGIPSVRVSSSQPILMEEEEDKENEEEEHPEGVQLCRIPRIDLRCSTNLYLPRIHRLTLTTSNK